MRWFSAPLLLVVGCAQRVPVAALPSARPSCPRSLAVDPTVASSPVAVPAVVPVIPVVEPEEPLPVDPKWDARVLASIFPKHLKALRDCPKPLAQEERATGVEVDDIYLRNLDTGRFVPVVERRERGKFTDSGDQIRYVIRLDNCRTNLISALRVVAVFSEWALSPNSPADWRRPRPILLHERHGELAP
jgi:hypothetical protein